MRVDLKYRTYRMLNTEVHIVVLLYKNDILLCYYSLTYDR